MAKRKPKPTVTEFFISTPTADENNTCTVADMPIPERITKDPLKMQLWVFICTDLEYRQCLSQTHTILISELVEVISLMYQCREALDKQGLTIEKYDDEGNYLSTIQNPHAAIMSRQQPMLLKLLEKTGMSPRDIHYLMNPDTTSCTAQIEGAAQDYAKITYFR
jgi:Phage terminase, small subunit